MSTSTHHYCVKDQTDFPEYRDLAMVNPQWLKQPISQTNFHGLKDVRGIEV